MDNAKKTANIIVVFPSVDSGIIKYQQSFIETGRPD
jgi:hypothetical protein